MVGARILHLITASLPFIFLPAHIKMPPKMIQAAGLPGSAGASSSHTSNLSSGFTFSRRFTNFATSNVFYGSASDRYLYCGCFVMSNLSEKNGRTPCTCKIHLPPSITASSSGVISSLPHCQVVSSISIEKNGVVC